MKDSSGILYLIPTPIGNLADMTQRAIQILEQVNIIFCEDTRVTSKLLFHFNLQHKKLVSYNLFNEQSKKTLVLDYLQHGQDVALVSDAGQPLISDPGYLVVKCAIENNIRIVPLAGPSAVMTALIGSGFNPTSFTFKGFLNKNTHSLKQDLINLKNLSHPIVIFESPRRVKRLISLLDDLYPQSVICVAKELTKIHETFWRGLPSDVINMIEDKDLRGEFVIIIKDTINSEKATWTEALEEINYWLQKGFNVNQAITVTAKTHNLNRHNLYQRYHKGT